MRTRRRLIVALHVALASALLPAAPAQAQPATIVWRNGAPDFGAGSHMSFSMLANDFVLASPTTLTGLRFWTFEDTETPNHTLTWFIHAMAGDMPGAVVAGGVGESSRTTLGVNPRFEYPTVNVRREFVLPDVALEPGRYWIAINLSPYPEFFALWARAAPNGTEPIHYCSVPPTGPVGPCATWTGSELETAFELVGVAAPTTVPEPSTLGLSAAGLLLVAGARRLVRRRPR